MKLSERLAHLAVTLLRISDEDMEALNEAAALARRVEEAPVGRVPKAKVGDLLLFPVSHDLAGKKVALVPLDDGAGERGVS